MGNSLLSEVEFSNDSERAELERWFGIIGEEKFKLYAGTVRENNEMKKVNFKQLKECAVYDHDLNVALYSIFRFVEYNFIKICTDNGTIEKVKICSRKKCKSNDADCILFSCLIDEVKKIKPRNGYQELKTFRNSVMHHKYILQNNKIETEVKNLLGFIVNDDLRDRKTKQINDLATDYKNKKYKVYIKDSNI